MVLTSGFRLNIEIRSKKDLLSAIKHSLGETYQGDSKSLEKLAENLWKGNQSDRFVSKEEFLAATQKIPEGKHLLNMFQGVAPITDPQGVWQRITNAKASPIKVSDGFLAGNGGFYGGFGDGAVITEIDKNNKEALKRSGLNDTQIGFIQENPNLSILEVIKNGETIIYATEFNKKEMSSTICKIREVSGGAVKSSKNYADLNSPFADLNSSEEARPEYHAKKFNSDGKLSFAPSPEKFSRKFYFDGKLDWVRQVQDGNCVPLASIIASMNEAQLKGKLESQISKDPATGDYIVYLAGAKQKDVYNGEGGIYSDGNGGVYVRVTADDMEKNSTLAEVDGEVLTVATAIEKYYNQCKMLSPGTTKKGLVSTWEDIPSLLSGKVSKTVDVYSQEWEDYIKNNPRNLVVTASFFNLKVPEIQFGESSVQKLIPGHRYAVLAYNKGPDTYTIANPWNSVATFEVPSKLFKETATWVMIHNL